MKKYFITILSIILLTVMLFSSCAGGVSPQEQTTESPHDSDNSFRAVIVQYDNDQITNEIRQTFIQRMRTLGYDEAKMKFDIKNAQGSDEKLKTVANSLVESDYDIVISINDIATKAIKDSGCNIPTVFIGVSDPIGLGLTTSLEAPDKNFTGTVNNTSIDSVLSYIRILTPNVSNVAIICMNNDKSISEKDTVKSYLSAEIYNVEEIALDGTGSIDDLINDILTRNDAIYITADKELTAVAETIVNLATANSKYVYSSNAANIEYGVLASTGSPTEALAKNSALLVDKVLRGTSITEIPIDNELEPVIYVSSSTATALNVDVSSLENVIKF